MDSQDPHPQTELPRGLGWKLFIWGFHWVNSFWRLFRPACLVLASDGKPL